MGDVIVQLSYATFGCVWMLLAYAGFTSVVIIFGCPGGSSGGSSSTFWLGCERMGSCGGSTISYASDSVEMDLPFLEIRTHNAVITTVAIRIAVPSDNPTESPIIALEFLAAGCPTLDEGESGKCIIGQCYIINLRAN